MAMTVAELTPAELAVARETYAKGSTESEWTLYLADCRRYGITPLDKKLHFQVRKSKKNDGTWDRRYAPVTSIDYMREVADQTGRYAGSDKPIYAFTEDPQNTYPISADVTVYKMVDGQRCGFTAIAFWDEYYPGDGANGSMWRKMPRLMLAKCAEALSLRKGFPGQLAGLYEKAEMQQADSDTEKPVRPQQMRRPELAAASLGVKPITTDQSNELWNLAHYRQWADLDLRMFLNKHFDVAEMKNLPAARYEDAFKAIDQGPNGRLVFHPDQQ